MLSQRMAIVRKCRMNGVSLSELDVSVLALIETERYFRRPYHLMLEILAVCIEQQSSKRTVGEAQLRVDHAARYLRCRNVKAAFSVLRFSRAFRIARIMIRSVNPDNYDQVIAVYHGESSASYRRVYLKNRKRIERLRSMVVGRG